MKVVIANLILFPWSFLVQRWKLIASFKTPLTASVTAKFLVRLRTAIRTNVGTPITNKAVGNDRTLFQIALELGVPTLNKAVRRKTGRTEAATRSFPKDEALETFSSCLTRKSSTPTFPIKTMELTAERIPGQDMLPEDMAHLAKRRSCCPASNIVSVMVAWKTTFRVLGP